MTGREWFILAAAVLLASGACRMEQPAPGGGGQGAAPAVADWPWPPSLDAVAAAPGNHRVLLENDRVRVLDVTIAPGETEPVHAHRWPSVRHIDQAGDFVDKDGEGRVLFDSRTEPAIEYPITNWQGPQSPHAITNLSQTQRIHLIRIELKQ